MSQLSKDKQMLLEMLCRFPNQTLNRLGLDRVINMSVYELESELIGEF